MRGSIPSWWGICTEMCILEQTADETAEKKWQNSTDKVSLLVVAWYLVSARFPQLYTSAPQAVPLTPNSWGEGHSLSRVGFEEESRSTTLSTWAVQVGTLHGEMWFQTHVLLLTQALPFSRLIPIGMLLVLDVQVLQRGNEWLCLETTGCPCNHRSVTNGTVCAYGHHIASQGGPHMASLVHSLGHTAHMESAAEVNAVQHLQGTRREKHACGSRTPVLQHPIV